MAASKIRNNIIRCHLNRILELSSISRQIGSVLECKTVQYRTYSILHKDKQFPYA